MRPDIVDMEASSRVPEIAGPRRGAVYAFFTANIISSVGSRLTLLAIPWFVLQTTGSIAQMGITAFFSTAPVIISAFLGSALVDRLGFKRASVVSDIVSGIAVGIIPLLADTVGLAFWLLLVLVFLGGLLKVPGQTARSSLLPDLAERAKLRLERANALADGINDLASFLGAPLAALLIIWIGTKHLLWLDAASFFISAFLICWLVPATPAMIMATTQKTGSYFSQLGAGIHFIFRNSVLFAIIVTVMITNLFDQALSAVLAPAYIQHVFHSPIPLGWINGSLAGCSFVGTLIFGALGHRLSRRLAFNLGFILSGAARFWILLVPFLPLLVAVYAIAGFGLAPLNPLIHTVLQEQVPKEMRARVFGVTTAGAYLGIPLGAVLGASLATWIGMQTSLLLLGALYLATTLSLLVNPALKKIEKESS